MKQSQSILHEVFSPPIIYRSFIVALVVGTLLNAINQGPALLAGEPLRVVQGLLTYCVPFFVSSYGSYSALSSFAKMTPETTDDEMREMLMDSRM